MFDLIYFNGLYYKYKKSCNYFCGQTMGFKNIYLYVKSYKQ